MLSFANPTLPEFSDDLPIAPAVGALQGTHGKPNTFSSYTTRRDTALAKRTLGQQETFRKLSISTCERRLFHAEADRFLTANFRCQSGFWSPHASFRLNRPGN